MATSSHRRRLKALEAASPDQREQQKARMHAPVRMIVEDREACDMAHELFELTVDGGQAEVVEDVAARLEAGVRILEAGRAQW